MREDRLDDRDRGESTLVDSATGTPGVEDLSDVLCELLLREPLEDFSDPLPEPLGDDRGEDRADVGLGGDIDRDLGGETGGISGSLTRGRSDLS